MTDEKIVQIDSAKKTPPQTRSLDDVRLEVPVRHWHYGRLCRAAATFNTTVADVLERVLQKEFGRDKGPPTPGDPNEVTIVGVPQTTQQAIELAIERWL